MAGKGGTSFLRSIFSSAFKDDISLAWRDKYICILFFSSLSLCSLCFESSVTEGPRNAQRKTDRGEGGIIENSKMREERNHSDKVQEIIR